MVNIDAELSYRVADIFCECRKSLNLTQRSLSRDAGLGTNYMAKIESHERRLSLDAAARIAQVLGVPLHQVIKQAEDELL